MKTNKSNALNYLLSISVILLLIFSVTGCSKEDFTSNSPDEVIAQSKANNRVIHHVSIGGNDACEAFGLEPGCDGNFSLVANMRADGSVTGQWNDTFSGGGEGIHVTIDCMVTEDNWAIVSGIENSSGLRYVTALVDNGTSNNDPNDQITFSFNLGLEDDCTQLVMSQFTMLDLTIGQVKVR